MKTEDDRMWEAIEALNPSDLTKLPPGLAQLFADLKEVGRRRLKGRAEVKP